MTLNYDMMDVFEHPENYADMVEDTVVGYYDEDTYLVLGQDNMGKYYFKYEDGVSEDFFYADDNGGLEGAWDAMISELKSYNI